MDEKTLTGRRRKLLCETVPNCCSDHYNDNTMALFIYLFIYFLRLKNLQKETHFWLRKLDSYFGISTLQSSSILTFIVNSCIRNPFPCCYDFISYFNSRVLYLSSLSTEDDGNSKGNIKFLQSPIISDD